MKDRETFLERWSRRKRDTAPSSETDASASPPADARQSDSTLAEKNATALIRPTSQVKSTGPTADIPFDVTKLPPLESITAETDIRAFLAPGVPLELTRAALRRTWAADPKIRDFVGLSENAWDFNAPEGAPGFGPLQMTDELRRQITSMVGRALASEAAEEPVSEAPKLEAPALKTPQLPENSAATEAMACSEDLPPGRAGGQKSDPEVPQKRHGRALPT
jgi:Protein of unknown function (DUF3306)